MEMLTGQSLDKFLQLWNAMERCDDISARFGKPPRWSVHMARLCRLHGYDVPRRDGYRLMATKDAPLRAVVGDVPAKLRMPSGNGLPAETFTVRHRKGRVVSTIGSGTLGMAASFAKAFARAVA